MEQLQYNLLFRWFAGLSANEPVWHPTVFSKNRERLVDGVVSEEFFSLIVQQARSRKLLSDEHFTVDGTLIEAWAGQKSLQCKQASDDVLNPPPPDPGNNPTVNFRKEQRKNDTYESLTDPLARLFKKSRGSESRLAYMGHLLTENRNGLVVDMRLTQATGKAEREAAVEMLQSKPPSKKVTVGADRGYDTAAFVEQLRHIYVTPHVALCDTARGAEYDQQTECNRRTDYPPRRLCGQSEKA
jgi:IS5 family transposase